jgi:SAM-dependent methyltransferase
LSSQGEASRCAGLQEWLPVKHSVNPAAHHDGSPCLFSAKPAGTSAPEKPNEAWFSNFDRLHNYSLMKKLDKHTLYEAAVQNSDANLDFVLQAFKERKRPKPLTLCEDFCGTARMAAEWVNGNKNRRAFGIDLEPSVLQWARDHTLSVLPDSKRERIQLILGNVLEAKLDPVDVTLATNFSYFIFHDRETLRAYFSNVWHRTKKGGALVLDFYGGYASYQGIHEARGISGRKTIHGEKIPDFGYEWEQTSFNAVNHRIVNYIHFEFKNGQRMDRAFRYDWRLWTLPELQELLREAGFHDVDVYAHGWDKDGDSDDEYRKVTQFDNEESWLAHLVAWKE